MEIPTAKPPTGAQIGTGNVGGNFLPCQTKVQELGVKDLKQSALFNAWKGKKFSSLVPDVSIWAPVEGGMTLFSHNQPKKLDHRVIMVFFYRFFTIYPNISKKILLYFYREKSKKNKNTDFIVFFIF